MNRNECIEKTHIPQAAAPSESFRIYKTINLRRYARTMLLRAVGRYFTEDFRSAKVIAFRPCIQAGTLDLAAERVICKGILVREKRLGEGIAIDSFRKIPLLPL